jgi:hypothetical protein
VATRSKLVRLWLGEAIKNAGAPVTRPRAALIEPSEADDVGRGPTASAPMAGAVPKAHSSADDNVSTCVPAVR